jgi:predicted permease
MLDAMPFRLTLRMLRRSPWFALTSIGTIALGIALASTVFAVVDGVLFKRLPYRDPDRLVLVFRAIADEGRLRQVGEGTDRSGEMFSATDLLNWQEAGSLHIAAFMTNFGIGPVAGDEVSRETTWAARVDRSFFDVLGSRPLVGGFREEDYGRAFEYGKLSAHPAIISYQLWRRHGGERGSMPGSLLRVGDGTLEVVGVLPKDFVFPSASGRTTPEVLLPLSVAPGQQGLQGVARPVPGVSIDGARAQLGGIVLEPVTRALGARERPAFMTTLAAVIAVVLLGSLNVAALLTARARDRAGELALRSALGARAGDLMTLMLIEALAISLAGAGIGLLAAGLMLDAAVALLPSGYLIMKTPAIDVRVLAFAIAAATSTLLIFTSWPAIRVARSAAYSAIRHASGATRGRSGWRHAVIAAQSALGIVVVLAGSLLVVGFARLWNEDVGFDREHTAVVDVTARSVRDPARQAAILDEAVRVAGRVPGVTQASALGGAFLRNAIGGSTFENPAGALDVTAQDIPVSAGFFETAGVRLVAGRLPTNEELENAHPVVVVSDNLARSFWPGREPIGQVLNGRRGAVTVVGIVQDVRVVGLEERLRTAEIYVPMTLGPPLRDRTVLLSVPAGAADETARAAARAIRDALPEIMVTRAESMDRALLGTVRTRQFQSVLFGAFACAGLVLFGVGVFGLIAMNTAARSREIGVRMALGASAPSVRRMVIGENLAPVLTGLTVGAAAAWWLTRLIAAFLYGISAHDPRVWALSVFVIVVTAMAAAWVPARRASRIDPLVVLKAD